MVSAAEKGATNVTPATIKALLDYIWPPLIEALGKVGGRMGWPQRGKG